VVSARITAALVIALLAAATLVGCGRNVDFRTLPVGAALPNGQSCADRVGSGGREVVPKNDAANHFVPPQVHMPIWADFTEQANRRFVPRIDGHFTGTTDEILQWGACKWGLDVDVLRAVAYQESQWDQSTTGDLSEDPTECRGGDKPPCPTSFGLMQLKHLDLPGSYPYSRTSTAFNVDYYGARMRACYEGWVTYLGGDYGPGDLWDCIGWHWSGQWKDAGALNYISRVRHHLAIRAWAALPSQPKSNESKVGVILPTAAVAQRWDDVDGPILQRYLRERGLDPDVENVAGNGKQLAALADKMIKNGTKVLVVGSPDPKAVAAVVGAARAHKVPTVDYDLDPATSPADYALNTDYVKLGEALGRGVIRGVRDAPDATVVTLNVAPTDDREADLERGERDVLGPRFAAGGYQRGPSLRFTPATEREAAAVFGNMVGQHVTGVLAAEASIADAVLPVLRAHGMAGTVTLTGTGVAPPTLQAILRGEQFMTAYVAPDTQAETAARLVADLAGGGRPAGRTVPVAPKVVTLGNLKSVFDTALVNSADVCTGDLVMRCNQLGIS
jgi:autotransporter family porin